MTRWSFVFILNVLLSCRHGKNSYILGSCAGIRYITAINILMLYEMLTVFQLKYVKGQLSTGNFHANFHIMENNGFKCNSNKFIIKKNRIKSFQDTFPCSVLNAFQLYDTPWYHDRANTLFTQLSDGNIHVMPLNIQSARQRIAFKIRF